MREARLASASLGGSVGSSAKLLSEVLLDDEFGQLIHSASQLRCVAFQSGSFAV